MDALTGWVSDRWKDTLVPLAVFLGVLFILLWMRRLLARRFSARLRQQAWYEASGLSSDVRWGSQLWAVLVAAYLGLQASQVSDVWRVPSGRIIWTIFVVSLAFVLTKAAIRVTSVYGERLSLPANVIPIVSGVIGFVIALLGALVILDLWDAPVAPLLLVLVLGTLVGALAFRDVLPSVFASLQISTTGHIKPGDFIRLESGEEGHVVEIGWRNTQLKGLDESVVLLPTSKLLRVSVTNYGRPVKRASEPFRFYSRTHFKELTGLKAHTLEDLLHMLKTVPDSVVYYHTHHFLEEHQYLVPEPASDFATWVRECLGEETLGEKLAAVDTFEFPTLGALRERLVGIIEEHLATNPNNRVAPPGQELVFVKSLSFITPTSYVAHDLRELLESLKKVPQNSLFFHIFESRLRLGRDVNDFSAWIADSLGNEELAEELARLDPYNYTLEGLRSLLIQRIEKRVH